MGISWTQTSRCQIFDGLCTAINLTSKSSALDWEANASCKRLRLLVSTLS